MLNQPRAAGQFEMQAQLKEEEEMYLKLKKIKTMTAIQLFISSLRKLPTATIKRGQWERRYGSVTDANVARLINYIDRNDIEIMPNINTDKYALTAYTNE